MKKTYMKPGCFVIEAVNAQLLAGSKPVTQNTPAADDSGANLIDVKTGDPGDVPLFGKQHTFSPWDTWDE